MSFNDRARKILMSPKHAFKLLCLALTLACVACGSPSDGSDGTLGTTGQDITNGAVDNNDGAVVALMLQGQAYCSGVVVANYVVITAAHCLIPTPPDQVFFGSDPSSQNGTFIDVSDTLAHPDFDVDTLENDVGIVGLASASPAAPLPIRETAFDSAFNGATIRIIGYGLSGATSSSQIKRTGQSSIVSYTDTDFTMKSLPSQTCNGDSGGPALATIGGKEIIIGLTSSGDSNCNTYGRDMRVDPYIKFFQEYAVAYHIPTTPSKSALGCSMSADGVGASSGKSSLMLAFLVACLAASRIRRRTAKQS